MYYYFITKEKAEELEQLHGIPDSLLTRSWENVTMSLDGTKLILKAKEPLDEEILGVSAKTKEEAYTYSKSTEFYNEENI